MKIGLMGCGAVALYGHLPALKEVAEWELWAIFDPDPARLQVAQAQFGVPHAFSDADEFFNSGIEAVTLTSPAPFHCANVLDAARHALPVLCEKPLAMNGEQAQTMIAAMENAGAPLYTAFCYRFAAPALKIKELVEAGAIGEVRSLRLIYNWDCHGKWEAGVDGEPVLQSRRAARMIEGGPMVDCGTHQIDLAHFWLDSPVVSFDAHGAWVDEWDAPDHLYLHLDHANGAHTMIEISYSYAHTTPAKRREFVYELIGTRGLVRYDREAKSFELRNQNGLTSLPFAPEKDFVGLYRAFYGTLQGAEAHLTSARDGQIVTDIARLATEKAMARRKVAGLEASASR